MLVAVPDNGIFGSSPVGWSAAIASRTAACGEARRRVSQGLNPSPDRVAQKVRPPTRRCLPRHHAVVVPPWDHADMILYVANLLAGGSFFFCEARALVADATDRRLRGVFHETRRPRPFTIDAIILLPDRLHTAWTLPAGRRVFCRAFAFDQIGLFAQPARRRAHFR